MTKRELNTILRQYKLGVSKDVCRTAILQLCCPSVPRKELNAAVEALEYFETESNRVSFRMERIADKNNNSK